MSFNVVARWLLLKPVLKGLVREAEEELVHLGAYAVLLLGSVAICLVFLLGVI